LFFARPFFSTAGSVTVDNDCSGIFLGWNPVVLLIIIESS
jgi:hypothetical protein